MALTALGGSTLYVVRRVVVRDDEVVVHERLERHSAVLQRIGLPGFERAVDAATAVEGEHGPVRVRDSAGRTLYQHGDVTSAATVVSTSLSRDLQLEVASSVDPWARDRPAREGGRLVAAARVPAARGSRAARLSHAARPAAGGGAHVHGAGRRSVR